jgi:hypothetical protein
MKKAILAVAVVFSFVIFSAIVTQNTNVSAQSNSERINICTRGRGNEEGNWVAQRVNISSLDRNPNWFPYEGPVVTRGGQDFPNPTGPNQWCNDNVPTENEDDDDDANDETNDGTTPITPPVEASSVTQEDSVQVSTIPTGTIDAGLGSNQISVIGAMGLLGSLGLAGYAVSMLRK